MAQQWPWGQPAPSSAAAPAHAIASGPRWDLLAAWAVVALVVAGLVAANLLALGARVAGSARGGAVASVGPSLVDHPGGTPGRAAPAAAVPTSARSLATFVYPDAVGPYRFVSKGSAGEDEVGYYAGAQGGLTVTKKRDASLLALVDGATPASRPGYWCWTSPAGSVRCGAQLRDGVLVLAANQKETQASVVDLMAVVAEQL